MTEHPQVLLPELGFTVDEGLEELIELCWRRGIPTGNSCIGGNPDAHDGRGHFSIIAEAAGHFAMKWENLTGYPVTWCDGTPWGVEKYPVVIFDRDQIPTLVAELRAGWLR
jgi:hypothetical protein